VAVGGRGRRDRDQGAGDSESLEEVERSVLMGCATLRAVIWGCGHMIEYSYYR
jgi:hypothetical protein